MQLKSFLSAILMTITITASGTAAAQHQHHVKHGMVLFGNQEVYASHIVYKQPHNFQVILRVRFDTEALAAYRQARLDFPQDQLVFVLDPMDLALIDAAESVTGTLAHDNDDGRTSIKTGIRLERSEFDLIFFNELPLSLEH